MSVTVTINRDDINRIKRDFYLMESEAQVAVPRVINRAITAVRAEAVDRVKRVYNLPTTRIRKNFSDRKATKANHSGYWRSEGRPVGLRQFGGRQTKKGVSVKVMASGARTIVYGAFIQIPRYDSLRNREIVSGPQAFWRDLESTGKRVDRYNINRLDGPRVEDALSKPLAQKALQQKADITIDRRLDVEANYILSKARS